MEERYELREKIGQGGLGSVHRAFDHRMKREVAIKRILASGEDVFHEAESTKHLMAEVGALASLQHPHIVTVYDVGSDEQGPYIVMEFIQGKTLDEILENAPLVWHDFKTLAMQSLEALIAAHELDMIHSDLKPANIMLTWLPSGAFQVKIVDFGLAVLIQNQSHEEIQKLDAVYGSVFFMPPEQYERKPLDTRSDLYSLGCCFYQALAGSYPFNGSTGMEVMQAHLNHTVKPIQEIRNDIPLWACKWVMWLINRNPDDRPATARDALANFLQNDKETNPVMSRGGAETHHPRLIIPAPVPSTVTGPVSTMAPTPVPSVRLTSSPAAATGPLATPTAAIRPPLPPQTDPHAAHTDPAAKQKSRKLILKIGIAAALAILIGVTLWLGLKSMSHRKIKREYQQISSLAVSKNVRDVMIRAPQLQTVLDYLAQAKPKENLTPAYTTLAKAKSADRSDFDAMIAKFTTQAQLSGDIRQKMFTEVIAKRRAAATVPDLLGYIAKARNADEALIALQSLQPMLRESHAQPLLHIITTTSHPNVAQAAETEMTRIIKKSNDKQDLAKLIATARENAGNPSSAPALDRLLDLCKKK